MGRSRGRPRLKEADKRSEPVGVRLTKAVRQKLESARRSSDGDRTLSQEIEIRLRRSFELDEELMKRFGSPGAYAFVRLIAEGIKGIEEICSHNKAGSAANDEGRRQWLQDRFTFEQVVLMINELLPYFRPAGKSVRPKDWKKYDDVGLDIALIGKAEADTLLLFLGMVYAKPEVARYWMGESATKMLQSAALPLARRVLKNKQLMNAPDRWSESEV